MQIKVKHREYITSKIANVITILAIAAIVLFTGCVGKETVPTVTPSPTFTPEQVVSTPTPTPTTMTAPTPKETVSVTLRAGYKWYQNDEFGYRIGYPENWEKTDMGLSKGQESGTAFNPVEGTPGATMISVIIYSDLKQAKFWEDPTVEKLKEAGAISKYGNVTINGRDGYEVIYDPLIAAGFSKTPAATSRWIEFTVNDLYYVVNLYSTNEFYSKYKRTFDDVINSFVIDK